MIISAFHVILMVFLVCVVLGFIILAYQIFVKKIIKEKEHQYQTEIAYEKVLLSDRIRVQESEREQIAVRLHDDVGSKLSILFIWLQNLNQDNLDKTKEVLEKQTTILMTATRNISHSLFPVHLEKFGLLEAIEELISSVESSLAVNLRANFKSLSADFELHQELDIYRIIQEFLSNTIKYSQATELTVHLINKENTIHILLSDNGVGVVLSQLKMGGMGIRNIELRLQLLKANYKWKSLENKGLRLICSLPKHKEI